MFEYLNNHFNHHEFLFITIVPIVLIAIYYFYDIDYKFLFNLSTYFYVVIPVIVLPFDVYQYEAENITSVKFITQQYTMFLVFTICCYNADWLTNLSKYIKKLNTNGSSHKPFHSNSIILYFLF